MLKPYRVIVTVQYPAWDEREGITFHVDALSKSDAIRKARRENDRYGQIHREQGRAIWRAIEA